jgi:hypothetical protein
MVSHAPEADQMDSIRAKRCSVQQLSNSLHGNLLQ